MKDKQVDLKNTVFMVMPFKDKVAECSYKFSTRSVVKSCGLKIIRSDEISTVPKIRKKYGITL